MTQGFLSPLNRSSGLGSGFGLARDMEAMAGGIAAPWLRRRVSLLQGWINRPDFASSFRAGALVIERRLSSISPR